MKLVKKIGIFYKRNKLLTWIAIIFFFMVVYTYWDKLQSIHLFSQSVWQFGGTGILAGTAIMFVAIAVGIALIASGFGMPAGLFIILGSMLLFGAKITGISVLFGMIVDFFKKYRFLLLIIGGILIFKMLTRSTFTYSTYKPSVGERICLKRRK